MSSLAARAGAAEGVEHADAVIVGAGFGGLVAARTLALHGVRPIVLEARDRVGGRPHDITLVGVGVALGAEWMSSRQRQLAGLLRELGVRPQSYAVEGEPCYRLHGRPLLGRSLRRALSDLNDAFARLHDLSERLPRDWPAATPSPLRRIDAQSAGGWIDAQRFSLPGRWLVRNAIESTWGAVADELSLLEVLWSLRKAGGREAWFSQSELRVPGGMQHVAQRLADELGGAVRLGQEVVAVSQDPSGVTARCRGGFACRARVLIVCVPPPLIQRLRFEPALPPSVEHDLDRRPMSAASKLVLTYDEPFWRADGRSGTITASDSLGLVLDTSPAQGAGILSGFAFGRGAAGFATLSADARRNRFVDLAKAALGPRAAMPTGYAEGVWLAEPFTRGGYNAYNPPGTLADRLAEPAVRHGRVFWGSTELDAGPWATFVEGAVAAGRRAAMLALHADVGVAA